jgi:hypothetical protein
MILDVIVTNDNQLRALRPIFDSMNPMPYTEPEKSNWLKTVDADRLNKRIIGSLGNRTLNRAKGSTFVAEFT